MEGDAAPLHSKSKQARGTTSHHAGGGTGKGSRQRGAGWREGKVEVVQRMKRRRDWRGYCQTSGGSTHEARGGLAGKQGTRCLRRVCCQ